MTDEEDVLRQTEKILNEGLRSLEAGSKGDKQQALRVGEQNAWESDPLNGDDVYDVWVYDVEFQGTPETLAKWNETSPIHDVPTAFTSSHLAANSCLSVSRSIVAGAHTPDDIKELLTEPAFFFGLAATPVYNDPRGLMVRTQAFATKLDDVRPSQADDRISVVVSCCLLYDTMVIITRNEETGEYMGDPTFIDVIAYDGDNHKEVGKCANWLGAKYGEVCRGVYNAINIPLVMKTLDPEMWEATKQDLLARQQPEQE